MDIGCHWTFTQNNWTELHISSITNIQAKAKYIVYGKEIGESGTPHLQGYIIFKNNQRFTAVRKLLPEAHWEIRKGTPQQASDYCKKDGQFTEFGDLPMTKKAQGELEQSRWKQARLLASESRFDEIDDELYIRYRSTFRKIAEEHPKYPATLETLEHEWWYGPAGGGKNTEFEAQYPVAEGRFYDKKLNHWWDGFDPARHDVVRIQEFGEAHAFLGTELKIWADKFAFTAEVKNATIFIRPKKIIIQSNYTPADIWTDPILLQAIHRRFIFREFAEIKDPRLLAGPIIGPPPQKRPKI